MTEDIELREILRATAEKAALPTVMPGPMRRKVALRRARTIGVTLLSTVAILLGGLQGMRAITLDEAATRPKEIQPVGTVPEVDYMIDLNTGEMTPLPEAIRSVDLRFENGQYAVAPGGSPLAYVGTGEEGSPQIFIAGIDGTGVRQMTHHPTGAASPAWSQDGTRIAYEGYDDGYVGNIFVLDVATGKSTQIIDESSPCRGCNRGPTFTPDGSSIIYTGGTDEFPVIRTVLATGGKSTLLIGPGEGITDAGGASLSPDGSLVTFTGSGSPRSGPDHCGPCRFVANADGTNRRVVPGWVANPAGTWSPDSSRIVVSEGEGWPPTDILVVDIVTGDASRVAEGRWAIWLDDHTLLVEV